MLTIQNLENINGIHLCNDAWILYLVHPATLADWYSFIMLKNHSIIEGHPNYKISFYRKESPRNHYHITITYTPGDGTAMDTIYDGFMHKDLLINKTAFTEYIEKIIKI